MEPSTPCRCPPLPPLCFRLEVVFEREDVLLPPPEVVFERADELLPPLEDLLLDELPPCVRLAAVALPPLAPALAFWAFEPAEPAFDCDDFAEPEVLDDVDARPPEALEPPDLPPPLPPEVRFAPPELDVRDDAEARPPFAPALAFCVFDPPLVERELPPDVLEEPLPDVLEELLPLVRFAAVARPPFAPALAFCAVDPPEVFLAELLPLDDLAREELAEDFARELLPDDFDPPVLFDPPELLDPPELFADARPPAAPSVFAAAVLRDDDDDEDDERDPPDFAPPDFEPDDFDPDDFEDDDLDPEDDVFLVVAICIFLPPKKFGVTRTKQAIDVPQLTRQPYASTDTYVIKITKNFGRGIHRSRCGSNC